MENQLQADFAAMGARVRVAPIDNPGDAGEVRVDVLRDDDGEYFFLRCGKKVALHVPDVVRDDRHLVLRARVPSLTGGAQVEWQSFLCGHDERAWFVAAVPESADAKTVQAAKDALKPEEVWEAMRERGVPMKHRDRRRTAAFIRQGEWFFIPRPHLMVNKVHVLLNEPIQRGAGKPHLCDRLHRVAGEVVWVCDAFPSGILERDYNKMSRVERRKHRWDRRVRNAHVFVKGNVRHPDHKTVWLPCWHEVVMNTETRARAMQNVAFLD